MDYFVVDNLKMDFYMGLVDLKNKLEKHIQVNFRMVSIMVEEYTCKIKMDSSGQKEFGNLEI